MPKYQKSFTSIDNICDSIRHYKDGTGKTAKVNSNLIAHIKNFNRCALGLPNFIKKVYSQVKEKLVQSSKLKRY